LGKTNRPPTARELAAKDRKGFWATVASKAAVTGLKAILPVAPLGVVPVRAASATASATARATREAAGAAGDAARKTASALRDAARETASAIAQGTRIVGGAVAAAGQKLAGGVKAVPADIRRGWASSAAGLRKAIQGKYLRNAHNDLGKGADDMWEVLEKYFMHRMEQWIKWMEKYGTEDDGTNTPKKVNFSEDQKALLYKYAELQAYQAWRGLYLYEVARAMHKHRRPLDEQKMEDIEKRAEALVGGGLPLEKAEIILSEHLREQQGGGVQAPDLDFNAVLRDARQNYDAMWVRASRAQERVEDRRAQAQATTSGQSTRVPESNTPMSNALKTSLSSRPGSVSSSQHPSDAGPPSSRASSTGASSNMSGATSSLRPSGAGSSASSNRGGLRRANAMPRASQAPGGSNKADGNLLGLGGRRDLSPPSASGAPVAPALGRLRSAGPWPASGVRLTKQLSLAGKAPAEGHKASNAPAGTSGQLTKGQAAPPQLTEAALVSSLTRNDAALMSSLKRYGVTNQQLQDFILYMMNLILYLQQQASLRGSVLTNGALSKEVRASVDLYVNGRPMQIPQLSNKGKLTDMVDQMGKVTPGWEQVIRAAMQTLNAALKAAAVNFNVPPPGEPGVPIALAPARAQSASGVGSNSNAYSNRPLSLAGGKVTQETTGAVALSQGLGGQLSLFQMNELRKQQLQRAKKNNTPPK
jgi:hypothetical protein